MEKNNESTVHVWEDLANAIIVQAVYDYKKALKNDNRIHYNKTRSQSSIEAFFLSPWFAVLSSADPHYILEHIRKEVYYDS